MSNDTDPHILDRSDPRVATIFDLIPGLMFQQSQLRREGFEPSAVVLPADLEPGKYEGEGATDMPAALMGLPIIWGDRAGLVISV